MKYRLLQWITQGNHLFTADFTMIKGALATVFAIEFGKIVGMASGLNLQP